MKTKNFIEVLIGFVFIYSYKEEGINVYQPSVILSRKCYVNIPNRISLLIEFSDMANTVYPRIIASLEGPKN